MNRNIKATEVEARLHHSLVNQVRVPQLDRRFDAGVWARIGAQEESQAVAAQPVSRKSSAERWLMASNIVGIAVAAVLVVVFGLRVFADANVDFSLPNFSVAEGKKTAEFIAWTVTIASLGFGLMFTPPGRWLRAEFT